MLLVKLSHCVHSPCQVQTNLVVKHDIIYGNLIHSENKGLELSYEMVVTFCEVHMDV